MRLIGYVADDLGWPIITLNHPSFHILRCLIHLRQPPEPAEHCHWFSPVSLSLFANLNTFYGRFAVVSVAPRPSCLFIIVLIIMTVLAMNRINFCTRIRHYIVARGIIDRYRKGSAGVNGAVLQAYSMEFCRPKSSYYQRSRRTAEWSSYSTSRIALATGVVFMIGSAGKWYLKCFEFW